MMFGRKQSAAIKGAKQSSRPIWFYFRKGTLFKLWVPVLLTVWCCVSLAINVKGTEFDAFYYDVHKRFNEVTGFTKQPQQQQNDLPNNPFCGLNGYPPCNYQNSGNSR